MAATPISKAGLEPMHSKTKLSNGTKQTNIFEYKTNKHIQLQNNCFFSRKLLYSIINSCWSKVMNHRWNDNCKVQLIPPYTQSSNSGLVDSGEAQPSLCPPQCASSHQLGFLEGWRAICVAEQDKKDKKRDDHQPFTTRAPIHNFLQNYRTSLSLTEECPVCHTHLTLWAESFTILQTWCSLKTLPEAQRTQALLL